VKELGYEPCFKPSPRERDYGVVLDNSVPKGIEIVSRMSAARSCTPSSARMKQFRPHGLLWRELRYQTPRRAGSGKMFANRADSLRIRGFYRLDHISGKWRVS